jgi:flagellar secretion chaperone FliS
MYQEATKTYQEANFFTATPVKLVMMCYDGAIGSLKLARECYVKNEYEAKAKALQKAVDIIHELNASLDLEKGGNIARNLRSLYLYMLHTVVEADLKKDIRVFDDVIKILEELESAWKAITVPADGVGNVEVEPQESASRPAYGGTRPVAMARAWSA